MTDKEIAEFVFEKRKEYMEAIQAAKNHGLTVRVLSNGEQIGNIELKITREF